jgi:hypothetical protein
MLDELDSRSDVIARQLAHSQRNKSRASYNRAEYLDERRAMMQIWAEYLDGLMNNAAVVPLRARYWVMNEVRVISLRPREQRAAEEILRKLRKMTGAESDFTIQEMMRLIRAIEQKAKQRDLSRDWISEWTIKYTALHLTGQKSRTLCG